MNSTPDRYALNWLLVAAAWVLLPLLIHIPAWMDSSVACLLIWRYLSAHHGWPLPGRIARLVVTLAILLAVLKTFGTLFGRDAGVTLLVGLLGLKFWELRGLRDYVLIVFLLYVLILAAFLYSQSAWLGGYMLGGVVLITATLFRLQQPTGMGIGNRLRLAGDLLVKATPLVLALYLLFPRIQGGLWGLPSDAYSGLTGMSETLHMGAVSQLTQSSEVAFRVAPGSRLPPAEERYWRELVLDSTDGRTWTRGDESETRMNSARALTAPISYTVTLEPTNQPWLVALDLPLASPAQASWRDGYVLSAAAPIKERFRYDLRSSPRYVTSTPAPGELARALALPAYVSPRVLALAARWREGAGQPMAIARAALHYFRDEDFVYTLSPPPLGDDPVDEFLFETRRGFCEHYAAAFTLLMRAAGVPARIVLGYQGGEINRTGDYLIVRQSDAHAWSEIWVQNRGWVRVDPTGAVAPERIEFGIDAVRRMERRGIRPRELTDAALLSAIAPRAWDRLWHHAGLLWDATNRVWNQWLFDYSPERQRQFLAWLGFATPSWAAMVATLTVVTALIVLILAALMLRTREMLEPSQVIYATYCRKLARLGMVRAAHEGAHDYAERCAQRYPELGDEIRGITQLYMDMRYGERGGPAALATLKERVRAFKPETRSLSDAKRTEDMAQ